MTRWMMVLVALPMCWCMNARAEATFDFVRYACVPENGMLDVEYRGLHDTVAGALWEKPTETPKALQQQGFYRARGFQATCTIGKATYVIQATQDEPTERVICGDTPEVYLDVTRNGKPLFHNVVFGDDSCNNVPSLKRFTVGEITLPWRSGPPEVQACYSNGRPDSYEPGLEPREICQWTFGEGDIAKRFPVDEDAVRKVFARPQK